MFGIHNFGLFLVAGIVLNVTPGPDTVYVLGRSIAHGREAGIASTFGICAGSIVYTCAAALGLSALLASSAVAFGTIKLLGVAYLFFLGLKMIFDSRADLSVPSHFRRGTTTAAFQQGMLSSLFNPKVALFFVAFLPQFIDPASSTKAAAFLLLGFTFVATGTVWCLVLAWFASRFTERLRANQKIARRLRRAVGGLFLFLSAGLAISK